MSDQQNRAVYVISVFAEIAGVHPQTLRNYERSGLLSPQRTSGGSRRVSEHDLLAIRRIQELTNEGVNLEGVKRIMLLEAQLEQLQERIDAAMLDLRTNVEETHRQYRRDLVPVRNTIELFIDAQNRRRGGA